MKKEHKLLPFAMLITAMALAAPQPGSFYASGSTAEKKVSLTFDDGPGPNTVQFLDMLDRYNVKATFFVLGDQVKTRPSVAKMIAERGHELASHTMQHTNYKARLKKIKAENPETAEQKVKAELIKDMKASREVIEKVTGQKISLLRMPHGIDAPWIHAAAKEAGFVLVNWAYGTDWNSTTAEAQIPGYIKALKPGAVLLLHDGWPKSAKSLEITEALLKKAKEAGYECVTLSELLRY